MQTERKRTALFFAVQEGHSDIAKMLLEHKRVTVDDILSADDQGNTILHAAARRNDLPIMQVILGEPGENGYIPPHFCNKTEEEDLQDEDIDTKEHNRFSLLDATNWKLETSIAISARNESSEV